MRFGISIEMPGMYVSSSSAMSSMNISLEIESMEKLGSVVGHLHAQGARIFDFEVNRSGSAALPNFLCQFSAVLPDRRDHPELLAELSALDGVILIEEI